MTQPRTPRRYLLNRRACSDLGGLFVAVSRVMVQGRARGRNTDAFDGILRCGCGIAEGGLVVVCGHSAGSKARHGDVFDSLVESLHAHGSGGPGVEDRVTLVLESWGRVRVRAGDASAMPAEGRQSRRPSAARRAARTARKAAAS